MALLSVIRRWHYRDHLSIREIVRRTGLSRNTIRKYLRSDTIEPQFKVPERPSKLDPFVERLSAWLQREMARSRKQKRTVKQLHADLVSLGYDGRSEEHTSELQSLMRISYAGFCWKKQTMIYHVRLA